MDQDALLNSLPDRVAITIDIDWCADWMIDETLKLLEYSSSPVIFLGTHATHMNAEILAANHKLGIHPNFILEPQKSNTYEELDRLLNAVTNRPEYIRSHGLRTEFAQLDQTFMYIKTLKYDISLFTPNLLASFRCGWRTTDNSGMVNQLNYHWEDSVYIRKSISFPNYRRATGKPIIMNFHPVHLVTNAPSFDCYLELKKQHGSIAEIKRSDIIIYDYALGPREIFKAAVKRSIDISSYLQSINKL